ncbi:hypothetical protein SK128_026458, partial [Halocaridina rubra]
RPFKEQVASIIIGTPAAYWIKGKSALLKDSSTVSLVPIRRKTNQNLDEFDVMENRRRVGPFVVERGFDSVTTGQHQTA